MIGDVVKYVIPKGKRGKPRNIKIPADLEARPISRQRKLQIALRRLGRCIVCGADALPSMRTSDGHGAFCLVHQVANREYERTKVHAKRRNTGAMSYRLESGQGHD